MVRLENFARAAELLKAELSEPIYGEPAVALLDQVEALSASAYAAVCELPASGLRVMSALLGAVPADRQIRRLRARAYFRCLRTIVRACPPKAQQAAAVSARAGDWSRYYRWKVRRTLAAWCLLKLAMYGTLYRIGYNVDIEDLIERLSSLI
jgi:hypothetical protein